MVEKRKEMTGGLLMKRNGAAFVLVCDNASCMGDVKEKSDDRGSQQEKQRALTFEAERFDAAKMTAL